MRRLFQTAALFLVLSLVAAPLLADDSAKSLYNKGKDAETRQDYEKAFQYFQQAWNKKPKEVKYRVAMQRTRFLASATLVHHGQQLREKGQLDEAMQLFVKAKEIDPSSFIADQEVRRTQAVIDATKNGLEAPTTVPPKSKLSQRLEDAQGPVDLAPIADTPITLRMTEDTKVIYETIGKLAGVNVLFDPDYTSRRVKIDLNGVTLNQALDVLAIESKTFWRPVTPNTIFIATDSVSKRKELEQNVIKTFYLTNISAPTELQDTVNAIRTLVEISRIQQLPSQGAIVVRGTPDQVALAEKIINDIDKARPEVVVEVAVLQVRRDKLLNLGITPPTSVTGQLTQNLPQTTTTTGTTTGTTTTTPTNTTGTINLNSLASLNAKNIVLTIPAATANFLYNDSTTKVIQNPQIRALDGAKASLKIGDRVPVATGSFQPGIGGVGINPLVNTQFQYIDVGVNIDITPRVHAGREITLKLMLDVSSVTSRVTIGGIDQPVIGQRKIEHEIRLKEGEANLLGGILEEDDVKSLSGLPGLSQIPFFKYFFSSTKTERVENEIVFMLTPHIVRSQELTEMNLRAVDVGTGSSIDLRRASKSQPAGPQLVPTTSPGPIQQAQPAVVTQPGTPQAQMQAGVQASGAPAATGPMPAAPPQQQSQQQGAKPSPAIPAVASSATGASPAAGSIAFRFDPETVTQPVGATFAINVVMSSGVDAWQVPAQISYDAKTLQLVNISNGGVLSKDGQPVALVHRDDPSSGTLQVSATRPPRSEGITGEGAVFTLTFVAKAPGQGTISIARPGVRNAAGQFFAAGLAQAQITVK
ncbi:MAG: type II and III secretion system protein [Candidatus Koribacter versatilis]|uniref:Type II and III secretion system protein n=1 Tax=Candidatus Korobacter versatilis TaxID=658062 RepID=A0A932A5X1_9BACT|nr:type II and III secretion system protein [Candidatus Koribacter versatilis]